MNDSEKYLFKEKEKEKGEIIASKEMKRFRDSQKQFKVLNRNNIILNRDYTLLEKENEKLKQEIFKLKFKLDSKPQEKKEIICNGSLRHIRRIINFMESGKSYAPSTLGKELMMKSEDVKASVEIIKECQGIKLEVNRDGRITRL